jgi:alpha-methylacyl-CoA racemase
VAALEPHFALSLCKAAGVPLSHPVKDLFKPEIQQAIAAFLASKTRQQLDKLAQAQDIPLLTLPA